MMADLEILPADTADVDPAQVAKLLCEAFADKKRALKVVPEIAVRLVEGAVDRRSCLVALEAGKLVGVAGLTTNSKRFLYFHLRSIREHFGPLRSLGLYIVTNSISWKKPAVKELLIESLAVVDSERRRGIGTALLAAVEAFARKDRFCSLSLEVVDTNESARRLYEKVGFATTKTRHYGRLTKRAGFTASIRMMKVIAGTGAMSGQ